MAGSAARSTRRRLPRHDNTFTAIDDLGVASKLCARFAHRRWKKLLNVFARRVNPHLAQIQRAGFGGYYWCLDQSEYASDVMFKSRARLESVYPDLRRMALTCLGAEDVLRFLSRKLTPASKASWEPTANGGSRAGASSIA